MTDNPQMRLSHVTKEYPTLPEATVVLKDISLSISAGDALAIIGPSGCGKSTLLNLIGALDKPTSGDILYQWTSLSSKTMNELAAFRNREIGFVLQHHHLLPQCSLLENVLVPSLVHPNKASASARAKTLLDRVGLSHRLDHLPSMLSGGECQRAAVARALINQPHMLIADEPTGSLNEQGARELTALLVELNREQHMTLIVATHAKAVAESMGRICELNNGLLQERN